NEPSQAETETEEPTEDGDSDDPNRAPRVTGPVLLRDMASCMTMVILLEQLLSHATDPDGDVLTVLDVTASSGEITIEDGGWYYAPAPYQLGQVTLSYKITDGALTIDQIALFSVLAPA